MPDAGDSDLLYCSRRYHLVDCSSLIHSFDLLPSKSNIIGNIHSRLKVEVKGCLVIWHGRNHGRLHIGEGVHRLQWGIGVAGEAEETEAGLRIPRILIAGDGCRWVSFCCSIVTFASSCDKRWSTQRLYLTIRKSRSISPKRRKSRSPTPRRRKSRSPTPRRRKSRSPVLKRYKRQRSRSSSLSPIRKSSTSSLGLLEQKNASEKLRKEEEEEKKRRQQEAELKLLEEETSKRVEEAIRTKVEESLNSVEIRVEIQRQLEEGRKKLLTEVAALLEKEKEAALIEARNKEEQARKEKEELEGMLEENRRRVEEAQRREALEQQRREEERYRELEELQRQKEEALRRKKQEEEEARVNQMKLLDSLWNMASIRSICLDLVARLYLSCLTVPYRMSIRSLRMEKSSKALYSFRMRFAPSLCCNLATLSRLPFSVLVMPHVAKPKLSMANPFSTLLAEAFFPLNLQPFSMKLARPFGGLESREILKEGAVKHLRTGGGVIAVEPPGEVQSDMIPVTAPDLALLKLGK
ncbi:unnamed protein product [Prunus armeniaca]|uniref:Uncharacterized protein n=1 Tax=Prunus armeniaca TaxID=36596 RepID=A0A6J5TVJ2_PRUAR|nr:unnamed protein product [Prunus armeniaca]